MTDLRSLGLCPATIIVTLLVVAALSTAVGVAGLLHHAWRARQERRLVGRARRDEVPPPPPSVPIFVEPDATEVRFAPDVRTADTTASTKPYPAATISAVRNEEFHRAIERERDVVRNGKP
jgi:hypothetical protein